MERRRLYAAINSDLLAPLGEVTVYFNLLTQILEMNVWFLIGGAALEAQRVGRIVTAQLSFRSLVSVYCSLFLERTKDPARLAAVDGLRKRLEQAEEQRNRLSHSTWAAGSTPGTSTRTKSDLRAKRGWHVEFQEMSAQDISAVAEELAVLASDVQEETFRILGWEPSAGDD